MLKRHQEYQAILINFGRNNFNRISVVRHVDTWVISFSETRKILQDSNSSHKWYNKRTTNNDNNSLITKKK